MGKNIKIAMSIVILIMLIPISSFAMNENYGLNRPTPETEMRHEDPSLNNRWTWLSDELCIQFNLTEKATKADIEKLWNMGVISRWTEMTDDGRRAKIRDIYSGKWTQSTEGIWSFEFDDKTIPVGITKIDNVLYVFNGVGELREGYEYYEGLTTSADGIVTSDDPEFLDWLGTQYLPECTSHE